MAADALIDTGAILACWIERIVGTGFVWTRSNNGVYR